MSVHCSSNKSSSSNSSSSLLPLLQVPGMASGDISGQLAQLQANSAARLAAAQGMDFSMLSPDVIRLLPMQTPVGNGFSGTLSNMTGGYMPADVCEAMLDAHVYDNPSMGLSMPVHLQPALAAQVRLRAAHRSPDQGDLHMVFPFVFSCHQVASSWC